MGKYVYQLTIQSLKLSHQLIILRAKISTKKGTHSTRKITIGNGDDKFFLYSSGKKKKLKSKGKLKEREKTKT